MLDRITPVVLTLNEEPNIGRCLERLQWARRVLVVDSESHDATCTIAGRFSNVEVVTHPFTCHSEQWNYAISHPTVSSSWILALDADYIVPEVFVQELAELDPPPDTAGYRAGFVYAVHGRPLRGSLYPPVTVLFRRGSGRYVQDGHTQRLELEGKIAPLRQRIWHDDRKPLASWLGAQSRYMRLEADKLRTTPVRQLGWSDRIRRTMVLGPPLVFVRCLLLHGLILDGRAGLHYTWQRTLAEGILALALLEARLSQPDA